MILGDFLKALMQLPDPRFQSVLWRGVGLTVLLLAAIYAALVFVIKVFIGGPITLPWIGEVMWVDDLLSWGSLFLMLGLSVFLMVPVASAISSFFLDEVADAVETAHYPSLPPAQPPGFWEGLSDGARFFGLIVAANLLAVVAYLILPFAALFIFYGMNGWLLGQEYFQMAAIRREGRDGATRLRKRNAGRIWLAGCLMAVPLSVPLVNLLVPILGAATFTHLYHRVARR